MAEHSYDAIVGFSGGVDSCTAALLLRQRGLRVAGVMMSVRAPDDPLGKGCGAKEDVQAARDLAAQIDLPLTVVDCSAAYQTHVLDYFRREYLAGRTPNPCVQCNPEIKFGLLPQLAARAGLRFQHFATGHYARCEFSEKYGRHVLLRGVDHGKDQSYFLYRLSQKQLARTWFPLGELHKKEVRTLAAEMGVPVHDKPDSQDFSSGKYTDLLEHDAIQGDIVDPDGNIMGKHQGYWNFTPGQRKGLGVAFSEPLYVIRLEPQTNRVVVGTRNQQLRTHCVIDNLLFHLPEPKTGTVLLARMRSAQPLHEITIGEKTAHGLTIHFAKPQHGVAPGQSLVLYHHETIAAGGIIRS